MTTHQVRVLRGPIHKTVGIDTADGITDELRHAYTRGQCVSLAIALHRRTGWPIVAVCGRALNGDALGPGDDLGILRTDDLHLPHASGRYPGEALVRLAFQHAVVLSPTGAVDIGGRAPLAQWCPGVENGTREAVDCTCPDGCVCRQACCTGGEPVFFTYLDEASAVALDQAVTIAGLKRGPCVVKQNHEAADAVATLVLAHIGETPQRRRSVRPTGPSRA